MHQIVLNNRAKKFIAQLPKQEKKRITDAIEKLPDAGDIRKLGATTGCCVCA